jgi:hypothetical protein
MNFTKELAELKTSFSALTEELKMRFTAEAEPAAEPKAFGEATLVDGTIVVFEGDAPAVGGALMVISPEGEVPAPDGTHETTDGQLISTEGGIITEIEIKEMEVEEEAAAQFASLEVFEAYRTSVEDRLSSIEKNLIAMLGKVEETFSVFEKFANQTPEPAAPQFGHKKVEKDSALSAFASSFKNLKK